MKLAQHQRHYQHDERSGVADMIRLVQTPVPGESLSFGELCAIGMATVGMSPPKYTSQPVGTLSVAAKGGRSHRIRCSVDAACGEAATQTLARLVAVAGDTARPEIAGHRNSQKSAPRNSAPLECRHVKGKDINLQMLVAYQYHPEAFWWTAKQWGNCLRCAESTVKETKTWKYLLELRDTAKKEAERIRAKQEDTFPWESTEE